MNRYLRKGVMVTACVLAAFSISYCTTQMLKLKETLDHINPLRQQMAYEEPIDTGPQERLLRRFKNLEDEVNN